VRETINYNLFNLVIILEKIEENKRNSVGEKEKKKQMTEVSLVCTNRRGGISGKFMKCFSKMD
jgi:hypothetical protein